MSKLPSVKKIKFNSINSRSHWPSPMNWAAFNLADQKEFRRDVHNEKFLNTEESRNNKVILGQKTGW